MKDTERKLEKHLREELDHMLFSTIDLNEQVKQNIRKQAAEEKGGRRFAFTRHWRMGAAAVVAAVVLITGVTMMLQEPEVNKPEVQQPIVSKPIEQQPVDEAPPIDGGMVGSELSELVTTPVSSLEEAESAFGEGLLVPSAAPEGYTLKEIVTVGMKNEPVRDVLITYVSGEKTVTYVASRNAAAFPVDMFTPTQVSGVEGFVFEQPGMVELFWMREGIQYSITGPLTADEAKKLAESAE